LKDITVPTLFLNTLDDPIVTKAVIAYEEFKPNKNIVLATTKHGGHLGYHEHMFKIEHWFVKP